MSDERAPTSLEDVKSLLKRSREDPTAPNFNEALQESARWLLAKSSTQHWFCPVDCPSEEEFSDLFEVSTFSLRLCEFKVRRGSFGQVLPDPFGVDKLSCRPRDS